MEPTASENDGRRDFDFLPGSWTIVNHRLVRRLAGCTEWERFEARQEARSLLGGLGNTDDFHAVLPDGKPLEGLTLRLFDPATRLWSIYWADDRRGKLDPPVVGRFENGRGEFFGDDVFEGRPIRVVFHWSVQSKTSALWEQAFSDDGGKTWETNWRMEFTKVA